MRHEKIHVYGQVSVRTTPTTLGYKVQVLTLSVRHCQVNTSAYETDSVCFGVAFTQSLINFGFQPIS